MWINSPSTLQPDHRYHGTNVLADMGNIDDLGYVTVYFTKGNVTSMIMKSLYLSEGWRNNA